jgi:type II secretory pathway pseudopilin PulG
MMQPHEGASGVARDRGAREGERGYVLIGVLFLMVMILIALSIAAPKVAADIQRDREVELMHRGMQYRRAIQLYYRKFGAYPPNMDALEKTNEIRFLRKRYKDPMTGKDEWHLIHFGEAKLPTVMGFFGQALAGGQTLAGTGPGGVGQNIGSPVGGSTFGNGSTGGSSFGGNSPTGGSSFGGNSPIGGSSPIGGGISPIGGNTPDPNAGNTGGAGTTTPTDPNAPTTGTTGTSGTTTGGGTSGSSSTFGNSTTSGNGQTFGGGGIIGVESISPKIAILEYKKKKHFNEWEFVYDPAQERVMLSNSTGVGQGMGGAGNSGTQPTMNSPSLNNGPVTSPTQPQQPTQPPQQQ